MFKASLQDKLKKIFDVAVSFNLPSEDREQYVLFVEVERSVNKFTDNKQRARVYGKIHLIAPNQHLPYGYFNRKLAEAEPEDTRDLAFYDLESSTRNQLDLIALSASFVYFYVADYNSGVGKMQGVDLDVEYIEDEDTEEEDVG